VELTNHLRDRYIRNIKQNYVICNSCMSLLAHKHNPDSGDMQN
jgi:hypothetical protein